MNPYFVSDFHFSNTDDFFFFKFIYTCRTAKWHGKNVHIIMILRGTRWCSWLRYCDKNREVASSIPDGVIDLILSVAIRSRLNL